MSEIVCGCGDMLTPGDSSNMCGNCASPLLSDIEKMKKRIIACDRVMKRRNEDLRDVRIEELEWVTRQVLNARTRQRIEKRIEKLKSET